MNKIVDCQKSFDTANVTTFYSLKTAKEALSDFTF